MNAAGPTRVKHMANTGLVIDGIFGQANDRVGFGYTWSNPADRTLDNQGTIDAYYRVQLTPEIEVGATLEIIFDPVRNPDEDTFSFGDSALELHYRVYSMVQVVPHRSPSPQQRHVLVVNYWSSFLQEA